jgi:hypothetical protein
LAVPAPTWRDRIADLPTTPLSALIGAYLVHHHYLNDAPDESGKRILPDWDDREFHASFALTFILSVTACLWARRTGLPTTRMVLWVLQTIIFGLAGFLAYRLSTNWPTLVRCPRCTRRRPVSATTCPHCHEAWKPLPATGAEIFSSI